MTYQVIGGMFGLEGSPTSSEWKPSFIDQRNIFTVNARSGIALLIEVLAPSQVWMPSYLCASMLEAVDESTTKVGFYEVNSELSVPSLEWLNDIRPGDLVVLVNYFGFPDHSLCASQAKEQGAWVLEDACQALLSKDVGLSSDFAVFSPRKFLGVPDGGILTFNHGIDLLQDYSLVQDYNLVPPPGEWWLEAFLATLLRRDFDCYGGTRRWFELFQKAEAETPVGRYAMSELSKQLLLHNCDYSTIAEKRVDNYRILSDKLSCLALFPHLSDNVVPLGFPIRLRNREQVRQALFDNDIYPAIHWPIEGIVPQSFAGSHQLSREIMTLPCDQRYSTSDMVRIADLLLNNIRQ